MPNIQSAKKRVSVNTKKNEQNRALISALKTAIKKFNGKLDLGDVEGAEALLPETFSMIDGCEQKGVIHKNNAANKKSALAKRLSDVKSGKVEIVIKKDNRTIAAEKAKAAQDARDASVAESKRLSAERKAEKAAAEAAVAAAASKKPPKKVKKATKAVEEKPAKDRKAAVAEKPIKEKAPKEKKVKEVKAADEPAKEKPAKAPKKPKE
ncbi:MAG: 30S ribosomal protein S20 [Firmicutes bacterium]|nr:30S ribosomal protein S20 [Bacillota bacterium]